MVAAADALCAHRSRAQPRTATTFGQAPAGLEGALAYRRMSSFTVDVSRTRSRRFDTSGQVLLRCRRLHALLDAGPFGFGSLAAHAHCDALAITLAVDGRRTLVDRGTYRYNGDVHERDRYRCTAAHNTAQIGGLEQASSAGAFLWSRRPRVTIHRCELTAHGNIVQASHDGFTGWSHHRTVVHRDGLLAISTSFTASATPIESSADITSRPSSRSSASRGPT